MDKMDIKVKHNYKAIYCDVDGTLLTCEYDGKISKKVRETIKRSNGKITVGIASGRPLERVLFIFEELGLTFPCVISGGAQIVDPVSREILWEQPILREDLQTIRAILDEVNQKVWVVDDTKEVLYEPELELSKPMNFFFTQIKDELADEIIDKLSRETLALTKEVAYHEGCVALKITHAKGTKRYAINKVAELLEVDRDDIIGVGDGYNDFPLFKACGLRVAVGNAVDELKEMADYVAPSVEEDGVAHVFEKFIFKDNPIENRITI